MSHGASRPSHKPNSLPSCVDNNPIQWLNFFPAIIHLSSFHQNYYRGKLVSITEILIYYSCESSWLWFVSILLKKMLMPSQNLCVKAIIAASANASNQGWSRCAMSRMHTNQCQGYPHQVRGTRSMMSYVRWTWHEYTSLKGSLPDLPQTIPVGRGIGGGGVAN